MKAFSLTHNTLHSKRLDNGVTLVVDHRPAASSIATGIWVKAGSRLESDAKAGLAHALEHMAFKGSDLRTGEEIAQAIDEVGGELDAYTSREITAFQAQVLPEDLPLALKLVGDLALRPKLEAEDWEMEKGVICQEIAQALDTPDDILFDYFQETVFPSHALGRSILGSEETVQGLDIEDFKDFRAQYYGAENLIFAAAGPISLDEFELALADQLADLPVVKSKPAMLAASFAPKLFLQVRNMEQVQLLLGWPTVPQTDPKSYAYVLLANMLGYGGASHLFMEIRERRGLVYMVYSSLQFFSDTGHLFIHASTGPEQMEELLEAFSQLLAELPEVLTEADLKRAKAQYRAGTLMARDSVSACVRAAAHQLAHRDTPLPLSEVLAMAECVTLEEIIALSRDLSLWPAVTALGPKPALDLIEAWHVGHPKAA